MFLGKPHPDPVVETASLASVEPPEVWYDLTLPEETVMEGKLSALQLEAVTYAVSYTYIPTLFFENYFHTEKIEFGKFEENLKIFFSKAVTKLEGPKSILAAPKIVSFSQL